MAEVYGGDGGMGCILLPLHLFLLLFLPPNAILPSVSTIGGEREGKSKQFLFRSASISPSFRWCGGVVIPNRRRISRIPRRTSRENRQKNAPPPAATFPPRVFLRWQFIFLFFRRRRNLRNYRQSALKKLLHCTC